MTNVKNVFLLKTYVPCRSRYFLNSVVLNIVEEFDLSVVLFNGSPCVTKTANLRTDAEVVFI